MSQVRRIKIVAAILVVLMTICVGTQAYVGLGNQSDVEIVVSDGDTGWGVWVDYATNAFEWHGPYTTDFEIWWSPVIYNRWYGVFSYNQTYGYYVDVEFSISYDYL